MTKFRTSDFFYELPDDLIATRPLEKRDSSRLLVVDREKNSLAHSHYSELAEMLKPGDRLVFNNTKVIPVRIFAQKSSGARVEIMFTRQVDDNRWTAMVRPGKRVKEGATLSLEKNSDISFLVEDVLPNGDRLIHCNQPIVEVLERYGEMPIPPYMERRADEVDRTTYQTVFAKERGAVAAPTAGLHFTEDLIAKCRERGIDISYITLHVGIGTFRPVKAEDPSEHDMHSEEFQVSEETAAEIESTRAAGGRVIAVGTTVVRTLEHIASQCDGRIRAMRGMTELLILPGHKFHVIDGLITNFHLPESTLLMLVSALYNREGILRAYEAAVSERYRFFSYGDGMLII